MCVSTFVSPNLDKCRSHLFTIFVGVSLFSVVYFTGSALTTNDYNEVSSVPDTNYSIRSQNKRMSKWPMQVTSTIQKSKSNNCENRCRPLGSEALPEGIVALTSNLEMRPLWNFSLDKRKLKAPVNLLAIAVGVKQKEIVSKMVQKFLSNGFVIMLFHYDGIVDKWSDLEWNDNVIHVSAKHQTKWWFAKRFLHPDVIAEYDHVFLWDEDLDVQHFHPQRYIDIVKSEGLQISQPALDPANSVVNHPITARKKKSGIHRRYYRLKSNGRCDDNSTSPPCIGWVEMMAPVFSKAAWRCVWYMIQNDMVHAWGLDRQLGYCAQGDRMKNVGVVDSEYIVHLGLRTLGVLHKNKESSQSITIDNRPAVRNQSFVEMQIFNQRWKNAAKNDTCWIDLYRIHQKST